MAAPASLLQPGGLSSLLHSRLIATSCLLWRPSVHAGWAVPAVLLCVPVWQRDHAVQRTTVHRSLQGKRALGLAKGRPAGLGLDGWAQPLLLFQNLQAGCSAFLLAVWQLY